MNIWMLRALIFITSIPVGCLIGWYISYRKFKRDKEQLIRKYIHKYQEILKLEGLSPEYRMTISELLLIERDKLQHGG